LPDEEDSAVAARGQRIHDALAAGDFSDLADNEEKTASRIAYAESEIVHEYEFEGAQTEFEQRHWDVDAELNHTWSARIDRHDWQPDRRRLLVIDDKTGWMIPPPVQINWQIRSEGALLAELYDAEETVVALIHPHHPDSLWQARVYSRSATDNLLEIVRRGVETIQKPNQRRIAGSIQCQWCPAKRVCPEYIAADERLDLAIADEIKDGGFTAINRRSVEERGEHVRALKDKMKSIEYILDQYVELMERDPDSINGYRLARKLTRSVTNEGLAIDAVRNAYGEETVAACLTFSIKSLEDILAKRGTRKDAKRSIERCLGSLLQFKKSKYFLDEARAL
jgi:hypothetical protein